MADLCGGCRHTSCAKIPKGIHLDRTTESFSPKTNFMVSFWNLQLIDIRPVKLKWIPVSPPKRRTMVGWRSFSRLNSRHLVRWKIDSGNCVATEYYNVSPTSETRMTPALQAVDYSERCTCTGTSWTKSKLKRPWLVHLSLKLSRLEFVLQAGNFNIASRATRSKLTKRDASSY